MATKKLLGTGVKTWGNFPAKDENDTKEPLNIQDFPDQSLVVILGAFKFKTNYGDSVMLYGRINGMVEPEKIYTTQTISNKLEPVLDQIEFPYVCKVEKGKSKTYKTEFTSLGDLTDEEEGMYADGEYIKRKFDDTA